jgi:hypothetical protein
MYVRGQVAPSMLASRQLTCLDCHMALDIVIGVDELDINTAQNHCARARKAVVFYTNCHHIWSLI